MTWLKRPLFWRWAVRLLVAGCLVAGVIALINLQDLGRLLFSCRLKPLGHAFALFFCACISVGLAWQWLLRPFGYRLRLLPALRLSLLGFFFNNMVPSGVTGEIYRVVAITRMGVARVPALASVIVERWSAFLALILATSVSLVCGWPWLQGVKVGSTLGQLYAPLAEVRLDYMLLVFLALLVLGFVITTVGIFWASRRDTRRWERFRLGLSAAELLQGISVYWRYPGLFAAATLVNLASPFLEGLAFSSVADALGLQLSPVLFLVFTPIFRTLNHLPITVNAVGTQEVASVVFWQPFGAKPEEAVAISVLIHALKMAVSLVGGPLYFCSDGGTVPQNAQDDKGKTVRG